MVVDVNVPQRINRYQRKLLEDLAYSLENHGNAPPSPTKTKPGRRSKSRTARDAESAEADPTEPPDAVDTEQPAGDDKQKGLFDRIKDTFAPSDG